VIASQPGTIRLLAFRNHEPMGSFADALNAFKTNPFQNATNCPGFNYGSGNSNAPDLCWVRHANTKMGIGLNLEQNLNENLGVFLRGMYADGKTEVFSYTSADRSLAFGGIVSGGLWNREKDAVGLGYAFSWLSASHVAYLNLGGIDGFIGDGKINYRPEQVVDIYYKFNLISSAWMTLDYQHISNPAFNSDRGPVDVYGARAHFEF
jgi:carbohydrate-selective porin OprB